MLSIFKSRRSVVGALLLLIVAAWLVFALVKVNERQQFITGVGTGALTAAIGLVVVLTYRASGVVNFAAGGMAMYLAYVYFGLRTQGRLMIPPAVDIDGGRPLSVPAAFSLTLVMAVLLGLVLYAFVFRPLRHAAELSRAVASIGLLLFFEAIVVLIFGDGFQQVPNILSFKYVHVAGVSAPIAYYELVGIVIILALILWALTRFTRFGLATVAAAENEKSVVLLGYSPNVLGAASWIAASVVAAIVGVLASPLIGLTPDGVTLVIIPALAAALLGGMSSFSITIVACLGLGALQSLTSLYSAFSWFPKYGRGPAAIPLPGVYDLLVLVVILVTLLLRSGALPSRGFTGQLRLPRSPTPQYPVRKVVIVGAIAIIAMLTLGSSWRLALIDTVIGVVVCLSVVVLTGFVGQVSVAEMSFAGIGAFVMAKVATDWGLGFPLAPLIGISCAVVFGVLCCLPALRIRGVSLAIVTLAIAVFMEDLVFGGIATQGGTQSGILVGPPRFFGLRFGVLDNSHFRPVGDAFSSEIPNPFFGIFCIIVAALIVLMVYKIRRSQTGLRFLAIRSNERTAATEGLNVTALKLLGFTAAAFIAGVAGVLSGYRFGTVTADYFGWEQSLLFFAFAFMGGLGSVGGAVFGGTFFTGGIFSLIATNVLRIPLEYITLLGGIGLIVTVVLNPDGVAGKAEEKMQERWDQLSGAVRKMQDRRRGGPTPSDYGSHPQAAEAMGTAKEVSAARSDSKDDAL